jgi:hypothetical protein
MQVCNDLLMTFRTRRKYNDMGLIRNYLLFAVLVSVLCAAPAYAIPHSPPVVPEPSSFLLCGIGVAGLVAWKKIRKH